MAKLRCERHYKRWSREHQDSACSYCGTLTANPTTGQRIGKTLTLNFWPVVACRRCFPEVVNAYRDENLDILANAISISPFTRGDCWTIWNTNADGYAIITPAHVTERMYAHHISYALFHGGYPQGREINHRCQLRNCVHPAHLEDVTPLEHRRKASAKPTHKPLPSFKKSPAWTDLEVFATQHQLPWPHAVELPLAA